MQAHFRKFRKDRLVKTKQSPEYFSIKKGHRQYFALLPAQTFFQRCLFQFVCFNNTGLIAFTTL